MPSTKTAPLAPALIATKGTAAGRPKAPANEPMNFKVSADFKERFRILAARRRMKLNELLVAAVEALEREGEAA